MGKEIFQSHRDIQYVEVKKKTTLKLVVNAFLLFINQTSLMPHLERSLYNQTPILSAKITLWACNREQNRDATDWLKLTSAVECKVFIQILSEATQFI